MSYEIRFKRATSPQAFDQPIAERHRPATSERLQGPPTRSQVAEPERLIESFRWLARYGGQAVGSDGIRFRDLGRREMPELMRALSELLLAGDYRPGPRRRLSIPKPNGGTRTLSIPDLFERVVSRSLTTVLTPFWENVFHPWSLGFRPRRSTWDMLIAIEQAVQSGRQVIVNEDIRQAFDNVPIAETMEIHRQHLSDPALIDLVEVILRGHENSSRGIAQGNAYSPTALNVLLDSRLDRPLIETYPAIPWRRYADNLVLVCQDLPEAERARRKVVRLLAAIEMGLKEQPDTIVDLSQAGTHTDLLGYRLSMINGNFHISSTPTSWENLDLALQESLNATNPREQAMTAIQGWIDYLAPTVLGDAVEPTTQRILEAVQRAGIADLGATNVRRIVADAQSRWIRFRTNRIPTLMVPAAAPPAADKFLAWVFAGIADSSVGDLGGPG